MGTLFGGNRTQEGREKNFQKLLSENKGSLQMANTQEEVDNLFQFKKPYSPEQIAGLASSGRGGMASAAMAMIANSNNMKLDKFNEMISMERDKGTIKESTMQLGKIASQGAATAAATGLAKDTSNVAEEDVSTNVGTSPVAQQAQPAGTFKRKARSNTYQSGINI